MLNIGRYQLICLTSHAQTAGLLLIYPPDTVRFDDRAKRHVSYMNRRTKQVVYGKSASSLVALTCQREGPTAQTWTSAWSLSTSVTLR
jgi:hypothetical protein